MTTVASASGPAILSNHGLVLLCIARQPDSRLREIAECVGITERATHRLLCDLEDAGYVTRHRLGRRNSYEIHPDAPLQHPVEQPCRLGDLVSALASV